MSFNNYVSTAYTYIHFKFWVQVNALLRQRATSFPCFSHCYYMTHVVSLQCRGNFASFPWHLATSADCVVEAAGYEPRNPQEKIALEESTCLQFFIISVVHVRFYRRAMPYKHEKYPFLSKKMKRDLSLVSIRTWIWKSDSANKKPLSLLKHSKEESKALIFYLSLFQHYV